MVPETIAVDAVLTGIAHELGGGRVPKPWSGAFRLAGFSSLIVNGPARGPRRECRHIYRPHVSSCPHTSGRKTHCARTTIRTFGMHQLREYVSGLTHPLMVNGWRAGEDIEFTYHLGDKTGFQLIRTIRHDGR